MVFCLSLIAVDLGYIILLTHRVLLWFQKSYTLGYFGRPFQAKGGPQGGAFDKDIDYARTTLGSGKIVKGLEAALVGMQAGGVRQVIVPYGDLSYPATDPTHEIVGPKPLTFSGQRALNFVLENPRGKNRKHILTHLCTSCTYSVNL